MANANTPVTMPVGTPLAAPVYLVINDGSVVSTANGIPVNMVVGTISAALPTGTNTIGNVELTDGTNTANILAATSASNAASAQAAQLVAGADKEVAFTTTSVQPVGSTDVTNYRWVSVHITSQGTNSTITFQGSNDNSNWVSIGLQSLSTNTALITTTTVSTGVIYAGALNSRYFRLNVTGISGGTTAGVIEFHTQPSAVMVVGATVGNTPTVNVGPAADVTVFASAAQTTTQTQADQTNSSGRGIKAVLDMTNVGTGSVTLEVDGKDSVSGKYYAILTGAAVSSNSTNVYTVYPGLTAVANTTVSDVLPRTWRIKVTANNANSATYSVGASIIS